MGTDTISNFDLFGNRMLGNISLRNGIHNSAFPSGIAVNCQGGFSLTGPNTGTRSSLLLTCSELGGVHGFNPDVNSQFGDIVINQLLTGVIHGYKGMAIHGNMMYLADFARGRIDVFDRNYEPQEGFLFVDDDVADPIPPDYRPNNIVAIGPYLYVLWSRRDERVPLHTYEGVGHGYISVFTPDGRPYGRFASRGVLNDPWAMIPAPLECGFPPGSFLVGNHGDGRIHVYDRGGNLIGPLLNQSGQPMVIEGLRGLAPHYSNYNRIFFTASPNGMQDGLLGVLRVDQM